MATFTIRKGKWYQVVFLDHCISDEPTLVTCLVCGWVVDQDKERLTISTWEVKESQYRDSNLELVNIIKSAIISIQELAL